MTNLWVSPLTNFSEIPKNKIDFLIMNTSISQVNATAVGNGADSLEQDARLDQKSSFIVVAFILSGAAWLLLGSILGTIASFKMHMPDWLGEHAWLTFGRIRPLHLNWMAYGWASQVGVGVSLWILSRVLKTTIPVRPWLFVGLLVWNLCLLIGGIEILMGHSRGLEWLELPVYTIVPIVLVIVLAGEAAISMLYTRKQPHLYISAWYLIAAFICFPLLGVVSSLPIFEGTVQASMNWWYAHNALGLWFTPMGLAIAYFLIPKVTGRPIYSYPLSVLGFWSLLLFYNWNGFHHLIGGPVPTWFVTISIAASVMMIIPVVTVAVNHHMTIIGSFEAVKYSPTLRFVVFAAMSYTFVSIQGSFQAIRTFNEIIHFTHYVVAHAHAGVYSFFTMMLFGAVYYIMPRVTNWEWHSPKLIKLHFWLSASGIIIYLVGLQWGGIIQGLEMNNPDIPFMTVVNNTKKWLLSRSFAAILLTAGHFVFAYNLFRLMHVRKVRPAPPVTWLDIQRQRALQPKPEPVPFSKKVANAFSGLNQSLKRWANDVKVDEH
jgi:cytochrome c oxidase cbb3-type subunit 1